jgi:ribonuclease HI
MSFKRARKYETDAAPSAKRTKHDDSEVEVYTDGACLNNQDSSLASAGIGAYFGKGDPRNLSESLPGSKQTNQRAELWAAIRALQVTKIFAAPGSTAHTTVRIYSDSQYVIKGITEYIRAWKRNCWQNSKRRPVDNQDLWKQLDALVDEFREVRWTHVKGHSGNEGNEAADRLATLGAQHEDCPPSPPHVFNSPLQLSEDGEGVPASPLPADQLVRRCAEFLEKLGPRLDKIERDFDEFRAAVNEMRERNK